ncbi:MAG TPA: sialate O-acetylesterase [Pseudobacteroides sp.]|uniref:sialate O-acetylesterase n=1 Tax=Pseudobacteroides sp. TaxID=1968840 RepID=UPI002F94DA0F
MCSSKRKNLSCLVIFTLALIIGTVFLQNIVNVYAAGSYKISGYIQPDFSSSSSSSLNSAISVIIDGTSYKASTDSNGYFEINNIPESQYVLKISKTGFLTRTISGIKLTGNIVIGSSAAPIALWAGDVPVNGQQDNTINMADVIEIAKKFNSISDDGKYSADLDLNKDGSINMADIVIIAKNFNKVDTSYPVVNIPVPSTSPSATPKPSGAPYKVFLLAGQSNMAGIGMNHELTPEYKEPIEGVKIYASGTVDNGFGGSWGTLKIGYGGGSGCFGPELIFGRDMARLLPDSKILLIKEGWSGTSLSGDWRPPSAGGTTGKLYTSFITNTKKALAALSPGTQYEIAGMCWMQGESDACAPNIASDYEGNLTAFINDVRKELNVPNMPFIIAMIDDSSSWPYNETVRQGEINVSKKVPYVGIFDTKDLDTDGMHYKTQGMLDMGALFAKTMYEMLQK